MGVAPPWVQACQLIDPGAKLDTTPRYLIVMPFILLARKISRLRACPVHQLYVRRKLYSHGAVTGGKLERSVPWPPLTSDIRHAEHRQMRRRHSYILVWMMVIRISGNFAFR